MKTKKHCKRDEDLIIKHWQNRHIPNNGHKLPDIGQVYVDLLNYASRKPTHVKGYRTLLAYYNSDEFCTSPWTQEYRLRTLAVRRMGLVSKNLELTPLGRYYLHTLKARR